MLAFSVRDIKAGTFGSPIFQQSVGIAVRGFIDFARTPDTLISNHPGDFELWQVGEFLQETGALVPLQTPVCLGVASALVAAGAPSLKVA